MGKSGMSKAAKAAGTEAPIHGSSVDWSHVAPIDDSKLESGVFKFPGLSDNRSLDRISQRELGNVAMSIRAAGREEWMPVRLWDFNSIGFGVVHTPKSSLEDPILGRDPQSGPPKAAGTDALRPAPDTGLREGDEVDVRIGKSSWTFQVRCQVKNAAPFRNGIKLGLRRLDVGEPRMVEQNRRETRRLSLAPALSLKARVKHPLLFGRWCQVSVQNVNNRLGFSFLSDDPSLLVFEGMLLDIHFELPSFRQCPMKVSVAWVHATQASELRFGAACAAMDWELHNALYGFLLVSRNWTPAVLKEAGFRAQQVKSHLRFRSVKLLEDYAEVLYLRRDAYVSAGKKAAGTAPEKMASPLDGMSRILTAHHQGNLVGSLTFTFPTDEETVLDSQAGFPGQRYPVPLPPKANLIEVSRLCIHESYRGTDLLIGLFEHGLKHFLLSDRHWLITSATDELLPMYERIGFVMLKASYKHPMLNNKPHHLIIAHKSAFLWGFGIGILTWNSVFGDLVRYLMDRDLIAMPRWVRAIIRCKLLFRPLARKLSDASAKKAFRKHLASLGMAGRRVAAEERVRNMDPVNLTEKEINQAVGEPDASGSLFSEVDLDLPNPGREDPEAQAPGQAPQPGPSA